MFFRAYDWLCDCFRKQPVTPMQNLVIDCAEPTVGINPLIGLNCSNPVYVPVDRNWNTATDHPQCWGAKDSDDELICPDRQVQVWRVVFPCPMVGTSQTLTAAFTHRNEPRNYDLPDPDDAPCQRCWLLTVAGMADPDGVIGEGCCGDLNGDYVLCWSYKLSNADVIVWQSDCDDPGCAKQPGDIQKSKWVLTYTRATGEYVLKSYRSVEHPIYRADSEAPCDSDSLVLTADTLDGENGCATYPATVELTKPAPIFIADAIEDSTVECDECYQRSFLDDLVEHGHSLSVSAYCGVAHHQWRDTRERSADPNAGIPYGSTTPCERVVPAGCCHVEGKYIWEDTTPVPCCPEQMLRWYGRHDPWRQPANISDDCPDVPFVIWELDLDPGTQTLTGTFTDGTIVYSIVGDLRCDGITRLELSSTTVDPEVFVPPDYACMVGDLLQSCNVRFTDEIATGVDSLLHPVICAGYDNETGHADFCEAGDTCEPSLPGRLVFGCAEGDVCWTRQNFVSPQLTSKTVFPRVACVNGTQVTSGGNEYYVITVVVYPVDGGDWAFDIYCETTESATPRNCGVCTEFTGTLIETIVVTPDSTCPLRLTFETTSQEATDCCSGRGCVGDGCDDRTCSTVCCPDGGEIPAGPVTLTFGSYWQLGGGFDTDNSCVGIQMFFESTMELTYRGQCRWSAVIHRESPFGPPELMLSSTFDAEIELSFIDASLCPEGETGPCCVYMSIEATCTTPGFPPNTVSYSEYGSFNCDPFEIVFDFDNANDNITVTA